MVSQILASIIFLAMFIVIITDKVERYIPAVIGAVLVIIVVFIGCMHSFDAMWETLNLRSIFTAGFWYPGPGHGEESMGVNWTTIIFIAGMMIMVEGMGRSGFFRWLCLRLAKAVNYKATPILIVFMLMSAALSMFIDSITVILFLVSVTIELSRVLKFDPVPVIIAEIFCANLGGAATMCGDPPNIIIGTSLGLTFMDFLVNTGLIVWIAMVFAVAFFLLCFRKKLKASEAARGTDVVYPNPSEAITDKGLFIRGTVIFLLAVVMLVSHATTGLSVAAIGVITAVLMLLSSGVQGIKEIFQRLDWKTLVFFVGLFIVVGGLEQTKVLEVLAGVIANVSGGNLEVVMLIILWLSAVCSAIVDNIPFAATMVPVIKSIAATSGMDLNTLAWALSIGTDIGGNGTPIGASANVVGTSVSAKEGHPITWGVYCKYAIPATVMVLAICSFLLIAFHVW